MNDIIKGIFIIKGSGYFILAGLFILTSLNTVTCQSKNPLYEKGNLLYENNFSKASKLNGWVMEGPGIMEFTNRWMHMYSPEEAWHHVLWCPIDFPASFIADWEMQNINPKAGVCIVFFAATGINGEDIFDPSLPKRDGTFNYYIKDKLKSYHISYYANNPNNQERKASHLRKNNMFEMVQSSALQFQNPLTFVMYIIRNRLQPEARIVLSKFPF